MQNIENVTTVIYTLSTGITADDLLWPSTLFQLLHPVNCNICI